MKKLLLFVFIGLLSPDILGQNCTIISKANNITPDKLCSPVSVIWNVSYTGVTGAGTPVSIRFDWNKALLLQYRQSRQVPEPRQRPLISTSAGDFAIPSPGHAGVNGVYALFNTGQIVTVWDQMIIMADICTSILLFTRYVSATVQMCVFRILPNSTVFLPRKGTIPMSIPDGSSGFTELISQ
jgi:hypothetical protein